MGNNDPSRAIRVRFPRVLTRSAPPISTFTRGNFGMRRCLLAILLGCLVSIALTSQASADQRAFGRVWGNSYSNQDWNRFYHYPYVYYPHSYWGNEYYRSADDLYYRYPPEMRVPVYNKQWHNFYPSGHRYHSGSHFYTDVY